MKQEKLIPKPISAKRFKTEVIPVLLKKMESLQDNNEVLHSTILSAVGSKKQREKHYYNPYNPFNINYCDGGVYFENLLIQFDIDFLTTLNRSPIIKNELHLSDDIVFFAMHEEEGCSEYYLRNFLRQGNSTFKRLFKLFDQLSSALTKCFNSDTNSYVINNLNYLDLLNSIDELNTFYINCSKDDFMSENKVEMIYESYLREISTNSGLDTTIIFKLHSLEESNPSSTFKIVIHTESYSNQSYIKLFIWSETQKQWNILLVPSFKQFDLNPTHLTTIHKPTRNYVDKIIRFCIDFSHSFI